MVSELGRRPIVGATDGSFGDDFEKEIGHLLREQRRQEADDHEKELNLYRSGSAPPTVDGSFSAVGDLFTQRGAGKFSEFPSNNNPNGFTAEDEFRSDPEYVNYYFSNSHLNPRLPPPLLSREDWRFAQRLQGGSSVLGGIGDKRKVNRPDNGDGISRASMPPGFDLPKEIETHDDKGVSEWDSNGLIGLSGLGLGSKQKSFAEIFQNDLVSSTPISGGHPSRPTSRNAFDENTDNLGLPDGHSITQSGTYTYAAVLGASLSRSTTPDPHLVGRAPSPCLTPIGEGRCMATSEKRALNTQNTFNGSVSTMSPDHLAPAFSGLNITNNLIDGEKQNLGVQQDIDIHENYFVSLQDVQNHNNLHSNNSELGNMHVPSFTEVGFSDFDKHNSRHLKRPSLSLDNGRGGNGGILHYPQYHHQPGDPSFQNYDINGYNNLDPPLTSIITSPTGNDNFPPSFENLCMDSRFSSPGRKLNTTAASEPSPWGLNRMGTQFHAPFLDPMYVQYMRSLSLHDPSIERNYNSYTDMPGIQKAYIGSLLSPQSLPYKSTGSNHHHGFYGSPYGGVGMPYPGNPIISNSLAGHANGGIMRRNEYNNIHLPSGMRSMAGGVVGPWLMDGDDGFGSSLLEEFKTNKTKCFELSEIAGYVVEFSADQYGSRFIQQKLETATVDEKNMVFQEIMPQALSLMTDVFGNYVVQKFFEHGSTSQIRELADKLNGHVLTLSLQMYGCRVIQKAIEVVDVDQKISMVEELDGHVMRCVRDQNGNHVIQKCIECVPEEAIQFIVTTFFDHVVTLSTHPYGCRVVQRILEHCRDPETQSKVMDEILGSVSMLAKDQYGNYVVQHVLEHGKLHERSAIIEELAGNIVQMSQQKFASNVVEKCLTFGGPSEREILVNEMLGSTDENEPLQAMMKDQFANYVVQKVLETCNEQQRELILSRIKVHLNALKKYTYGKHIVARVEKLVAAGERRIIAVQSEHPA